MIDDRTYHRLFHLDWIQADVDGDGRSEQVLNNDQVGPRPPEHSYKLSATGSPTEKPGTTQRFYFDGVIYEGWSNVPEQYKTPASKPERAGARLKSSPSRGSGSGSTALVSRDPGSRPRPSSLCPQRTIDERS